MSSKDHVEECTLPSMIHQNVRSLCRNPLHQPKSTESVTKSTVLTASIIWRFCAWRGIPLSLYKEIVAQFSFENLMTFEEEQTEQQRA